MTTAHLIFALWALGAVHTAALVRHVMQAQGDDPDVDLHLVHALAWPAVAIVAAVAHVLSAAMAIVSTQDPEGDDARKEDDDE